MYGRGGGSEWVIGRLAGAREVLCRLSIKDGSVTMSVQTRFWPLGATGDEGDVVAEALGDNVAVGWSVRGGVFEAGGLFARLADRPERGWLLAEKGGCIARLWVDSGGDWSAT